MGDPSLDEASSLPLSMDCQTAVSVLHIQQYKQQSFYGHYAGEPVLASIPSWELEDFVLMEQNLTASAALCHLGYGEDAKVFFAGVNSHHLPTTHADSP